jgi:hypothetical protein
VSAGRRRPVTSRRLGSPCGQRAVGDGRGITGHRGAPPTRHDNQPDFPPSRSPSASVCEPYREAIEVGLSAATTAASAAATRASSVSCGSCRAQCHRRPARSSSRLPARKLRSTTEHRPNGARPAERQVPAHAAVHDDSRLHPQECPSWHKYDCQLKKILGAICEFNQRLRSVVRLFSAPVRLRSFGIDRRFGGLNHWRELLAVLHCRPEHLLDYE